MAIENPLDKPVVLFSMNIGALTTVVGLLKLTDFETYFNVPFALGCFLVGAIASLLHLYYRQLADDDFALKLGLVDLTPDTPPTPQRRIGLAGLVILILLAMGAVVGAVAVETTRELADVRQDVTRAEAEVARLQRIAMTMAVAVRQTMSDDEKAREAREETRREAQRANADVAAAKKLAAAAKAGEARAASTVSTRVVNLAGAGVLLAFIAIPLCMVLAAWTPAQAASVERLIRVMCGCAALLSLMVFVLGLTIGSVPGITAGLSAGAAAIDDVGEAPLGPAAAAELVREGRDGRDGRDGLQGIPGLPGATIGAGVPIVVVLQGPPGKDGEHGANGQNGLNGLNGRNGLNGANGVNSLSATTSLTSVVDQTGQPVTVIQVPGPPGKPGDPAVVRKCFFGLLACPTQEHRKQTAGAPAPTPPPQTALAPAP